MPDEPLFRCLAPACGLLLAPLPPPEQPEPELLARAPAWLRAAGIPVGHTHPQRRREWLAGRLAALDALARLTSSDLRIGTDEFGRPYLAGPDGARVGAVSLSHGGGRVAALVAVGAGRRAGLDVEPERAKTLALAARFLSPFELAAVGADPARAALTWSLKETLYKLYGRRQLDFRQHLALDVAAWPALGKPLPETGSIGGRIQHPTDAGRAWTHHLRYEQLAPHGWLTYCVGGE